MTDILLNTAKVANLARTEKVNIYQIFTYPECQPFLPPKGGVGESRYFNARHAMLLVLLCDLNRWGLSIPSAGRIVTRIGEALFTDPDADSLVIEFREVGASFYLTGDAITAPESDAAHAAGKVRFRVTIELATYRRAVAAAAGLIGESDA